MEEDYFMCKLGGGEENRCLKHHPVTKFVVKIVSARTKADNDIIDNSMKTLNREGKNAPSPEPEVVKSWIETEKFKAQYDPALSDHDRKIQMNRLNGASPEKVKGNHFHVWKNLEGSVRTKVAQRIAAAGLVIGMSASLVGCFATGGENQNQSPVPTNSPTTISAPATYGDVVGSGKKVKASDGTYETITFAADHPVYKYDPSGENHQYLESEGWTKEDGENSQRMAVDYMTKEFIDSKALEGGDKAYQQWYKTEAKKYYESELYKSIKSSDSNVILGNFAGDNSMPNLIHDGKPREKSLDLEIQSVVPFENESGRGVEVIVNYTAEYRVDDESAINFAALAANLKKQEFLDSGHANDNLLDGKGENHYQVKGYSSMVFGKDADGEMKIVGFESRTEYDTGIFIKK